MLEESKEQLKIEYTIISRGTEKYGSRGYMGVSQIIDGNRYFVLANHYDEYVKSYKDSFIINASFNIETITLSRFELITKLALKGKENFVQEKILICGFGNIGFATLIYLLNNGYKKIDILVKDKNNRYEKTVSKLNRQYNSEIAIVNEIIQCNTYIEATGNSEVIREIVEKGLPNTSLFLLGTPRECKYAFNPLAVHRKNINIFGGHELNGHSFEERNEIFLNLLVENNKLQLKDYVSVYEAQEDVVNKVLKKKNNFFEVIKYDI